MKKLRYLLAATALLAAATFTVQAQNGTSKDKGSVKGTVTEKEGGAPVEYAVVTLLPDEVYCLTDTGGGYKFENVDPGKHTVSIEYVGMEKMDSVITVIKGSVRTVDFQMTMSSFHLDKVVITATKNDAGKSTSSTISRQAMDHLQTSSLKDVMALLPGAVIENPDLSTSNTLTLRSLSDAKDSDAGSMNSLGTAIIIDGAPISNNANMMTLSTGINGGASAIGGASPGTGIDVRTLSTDNVESIEVIRGIPSVEYGDLTSGAVIVKSKAGAEPLTLRFKTNPQLYQASASKGLFLGKKAGNLNLSADYAYSNSSATESYAYYQRFSAKALWSIKPSDYFNTNTSVDFIYGKDTRNRNPDDASTKYASGATDVGVRFNNNGTLSLDAGWLKSIKYSLSGSYTDKSSFKEEQFGNATAIYSTSMTDGAVISNVAGQHVFGADGNEITSFTGTDAEKSYAKIMPYSYFTHYDIYGKEVNAFAKVNANFFKSWNDGKITNRIMAGADFKTDGNLGKGLVFEEGNPPPRSVSHQESGYRSRPFYEVPFVNQLGLFIEDGFTAEIAGRKLNLTVGGRYDLVNGKTAITPRTNLSFEIIPDILTLRGGYGITAKAPTAIYLYPQNVYFDQINYNGMETTLPQSEQLLISTTKIYDAANPDLEIATNRKYEAGFDLKLFDKYTLSVTAYDELMTNGYSFGADASTFALNRYVKYAVDHTNTGAVPSLKENAVYNYFFQYYRPQNSEYMHNRGIEYELNLGRFDAINTSVYINGAWMRTQLSSSAKSYSSKDNGNELEHDIAIYPALLSSDFKEELVSTVRLTTNIPQIGFVITLTPQIIWYYSYWYETGVNSDGSYADEKYTWYIDHKDGLIKEATPEFINDTKNAYMLPSVSAVRFVKEKYFPTVVFNFNITKEIGDLLTASFFVNNMFNSHPLYELKATPGSFKSLNSDIYFGMEIKMTIK